MFQSLRIGTPLYVLHKNEPRLEVGEVTHVTTPVNQFGQPVYGNNQPATVDVQIRCGERSIELKQLPATLAITDYGNGRVIAESRDAISNEIAVMRQNSQRILESTEQHTAIVRKCDELLQELNPQVKQEAERQREIEMLGKRVGGLENSLVRIEELLIQSMKPKKKEE